MKIFEYSKFKVLVSKWFKTTLKVVGSNPEKFVAENTPVLSGRLVLFENVLRGAHHGNLETRKCLQQEQCTQSKPGRLGSSYAR